MAYDGESYRGTLGANLRSSPGINVLATPATTDTFVEVIQALRPENALDSEVFSTVLQHDGQPINIELNPDRWYGFLESGEPPLGLAVARNVASRRRFLWKKGLAPGIYTVSKTVFAKQPESRAETDLKAHVRENTHSFLTLGRSVEVDSIRRATEDEVAAAIDTIFMAAAGVTTEYPAINTLDDFPNTDIRYTEA